VSLGDNIAKCSSSSVDLVLKVARPVLQGRVASIEVREDAERDWCHNIQQALRMTVLAGNCFNVSDSKQVSQSKPQPLSIFPTRIMTLTYTLAFYFSEYVFPLLDSKI